MKKLFWRIYIFFDLWGKRDDYLSPDSGVIDAAYAWDLATAISEHIEVWQSFEELK